MLSAYESGEYLFLYPPESRDAYLRCLPLHVYARNLIHASVCSRGKFQGIIGVVVAFGYAVGPILGGALAQKINWRVCTCFVAAVDDARECRIFSLIPLCINACYQWCFWIEPPVSLAATIVVMIVLPLKAVEGNFRRYLRKSALKSHLTNSTITGS